MTQSDTTLRIIGGKWRSRKVSFPDRPDLRPTPDRVRETLFNWLQFETAGARCLELYAGSGILSIEALSRGADHITVIDNDAVKIRAIRENLTRLEADEASFTCVEADARGFIERLAGPAFDVVFLDPPFNDDFPFDILGQLKERGLMVHGSRCYVETGQALESTALPEGFAISRQKRAGQVHYALLEIPD